MNTLEAVKKYNLEANKNQTKPIEITKKLISWWANLDKLAVSAEIIPTDFRLATRSNGATRRAWCVANPKSVLMVSRSDIATKNGSDRPENTINAKLATLAPIKGTSAKKIGYIRVLDKSVAVANPTHAQIEMVYCYRIAK